MVFISGAQPLHDDVCTKMGTCGFLWKITLKKGKKTFKTKNPKGPGFGDIFYYIRYVQY